MTPELKEYLLNYVLDRLPEMTEKAKSIKNIKSDFVDFPFYINGVIDTLTWDVVNQKFISATFQIADTEKDITLADWLENAVYCKKVKHITIEL